MVYFTMVVGKYIPGVFLIGIADMKRTHAMMVDVARERIGQMLMLRRMLHPIHQRDIALVRQHETHHHKERGDNSLQQAMTAPNQKNTSRTKGKLRRKNTRPPASRQYEDLRGGAPSFGRPFIQIFRHSDAPLLSFSLGRRFSQTPPEQVLVADHRSGSGFFGTVPSADTAKNAERLVARSYRP